MNVALQLPIDGVDWQSPEQQPEQQLVGQQQTPSQQQQSHQRRPSSLMAATLELTGRMASDLSDSTESEERTLGNLSFSYSTIYQDFFKSS